MSEPAVSPPQLVTELKVSAHLMQLDTGVYCVYNTPGAAPPDPATGLPGARLSLPPGQAAGLVTITSFQPDGWLGAPDAAALVRVTRGPAQVMMTIYQDRNAAHEAPRLQVTKLVDGSATAGLTPAVAPPSPDAAAAPAATPAADPEAEIAAHLQLRGDVLARLGQWVGDRGGERWVEGFALSPRHPVVRPADIEYQAVLGRGWLSPWAEGGQYCGSRGMALPILGLRARLRGKAAEAFTLEINATFTDGTAIGPVGPGDACEAESLAPLEAFNIAIVPVAESAAPAAALPAEAGTPEPATRAAAAPRAKRARR